MKRLILFFLFIMAIPSLCFAHCEVTIDGNCRLDVDVAEYEGISAPATAPLGSGRMYFDSLTNKFKCSENGGAYQNCIGAGGGGEANTASNQGVGGVGLFDLKSGVDLQFRNINAGSSKISVNLDAGNKEVDIDAVEANFNHDNLSGFVANEHLDWTSDQGATDIHANNIPDLSGTYQSADADLTDLSDGTLTGTKVDQASTAVRGTIEVATVAETDTGTDAGRAVSPDGLAESIFGTKNLILKWQDEATALATGDGAMCFTVPAELDGMNLVSVGAHVYTVSTSGLPAFQIRNQADTVDMLSTAITIDANEKDSSTAATAAVINASNDDVIEGDEVCVDVDGAGTGAQGGEVRVGFRLP